MTLLQKNFDRHSFEVIAKENESFVVQELQKLNRDIGADMLFVASRTNNTAATLISLSGEQHIENLPHNLSGSLCKMVLDSKACCFPTNTYERFPQDVMLKDMNVQGYVGAPVMNEANDNVGIVVALYIGDNKVKERAAYSVYLFAQFISTFIQMRHQDKRLNAQLTLLDEVGEIAATGAWEYHSTIKALFCTQEAKRIYGVSADEEPDIAHILSHYAHSHRRTLLRAFARANRYGEAFEVEFAYRHPERGTIWVVISGKAEVDAKGQVYRIYGAVEDVTEQTSLLLQNQEKTQSIRTILDSINDAVITIDAAGIIRECNSVALKMFEYPDEMSLEGQNVSVLMPEPYASKHAHYMAHYQQTGQAGIIGVGRQLPAKRKSGDVFQMELQLTEAYDRGEKKYIGVVRDISERLKAQDTIYNLAYTDKVTELQNVLWFERECKNVMLDSTQRHECIHVMLIDIDKMSLFNAQFGFERGNDALKTIAQNIKSTLEGRYDMFKYNADAFILLAHHKYRATETHRFGVDALEKALLDEEHYAVTVDGQHRALSASVGSAIFDPAKHSYDSILNILEHAMRTAKKDAPFGFCHVNEDGIEQFSRFLAIQHHVEGVVDTDELSLALQPQYNSAGHFTSFEALLRWQSKELGFVSPADFIPLAEESGAIISIGEWVIEHACKAIKELMYNNLDATVSVNVSAKQIVSIAFPQTLLRIVNHYGVSPKTLILELTETALVEDIDAVKATMNALSTYGFRFSIDDFGTGYSSLAYLKELPLSELKIDKYFVDDIASDATTTSYPIIDAIINIAKALGVRSVAEGVETEAQRAYLEKKGCELYQGYLFSKPLDINDWREQVNQTRNDRYLNVG